MALTLAFFAGLVLTLTTLGTIAAVIGRLVTRGSATFDLGAAVLSALAGLVTLFAPVVRRYVPDPDVRRRRGAAGAFVYGTVYSVATITTSAGPLFLLLTVAAAIGRPWYGAGLSFAYGAGRGLPFLALGLIAGRVAAWVDRADRSRRTAEILSGVALLGLAIYFTRLAVRLWR